MIRNQLCKELWVQCLKQLIGFVSMVCFHAILCHFKQLLSDCQRLKRTAMDDLRMTTSADVMSGRSCEGSLKGKFHPQMSSAFTTPDQFRHFLELTSISLSCSFRVIHVLIVTLKASVLLKDREQDNHTHYSKRDITTDALHDASQCYSPGRD